MSKEVITLGCPSTHNGTVITASGDVFYGFDGVARIGDKHSCPVHGITTIVATPQSIYFVNNRLVAVQGAQAGCGAVLKGNKGATVVVTN